MSTVVTYAYGHDFGNSEICDVMYRDGKPITMSTPTAFAKVDPRKMRNLGVDVKDALVISINGESAAWGIGTIAMAQSIDFWDGKGDLMRYASEHSLRSILAMSGTMIPDEEYRLLVATGLPADTFLNNNNIRKEIKTAISGTHRFKLHGDKKERICHIEHVATLMEGAGALKAYTRKDQIAPLGAAVVDIGGRTTDLYVERNGVPVSEFCKGRPVGVASASKMLQDAFFAKHDFPLSSIDVRAMFYAYAESLPPMDGEDAKVVDLAKVKEGKATKPKLPNYPKMTKFGDEISRTELHDMVLEAIASTTKDIVSFVSATWRESDSSTAIAVRFSPVLLIGGGAYYFYPALKKRIPHLQRPKSPVFANAQGYALAAAKVIEKRVAQAAKAEKNQVS